MKRNYTTTSSTLLFKQLKNISSVLLLLCTILQSSNVAKAAPNPLSNRSKVSARPVKQSIVTSRADSGAGTLRQVLSTAASGDIITFKVRGTIFLESPLLVDENVQIQGPGKDKLTIDGQNTTALFFITNGVSVTISDLTLADGYNFAFLPQGNGGAIQNLGNLALIRCVVTGSISEFGDGGGIYSAGNLGIYQCSLSNNAAVYGGAIADVGQQLIINSSTLNANEAGVPGGAGGGAILKASGIGLLTNVTISGNIAAEGNGGGILVNTQIHLESCTVVSNIAAAMVPRFGIGGGLAVIGTNAAAELHNTIVAGNTAVQTIGVTPPVSIGPDIYGLVVSQGWNLIEDPQDAVITGDLTGNILGEDPMLGPLRDNGGLTWTHALLEGSPAIDSASPFNFPPTDERGVIRPQDGDADGVNRADIGAYEKILKGPFKH